MKYNGHELRWHFRNGTYKELDKAVWWCGDMKLVGYIYRRQDGRTFTVWFVKYPNGEKVTDIHEFSPDEVEEYKAMFEQIRTSIANEYGKEK